MKIKYSVITTNFNNYEILRDPLETDDNAEYICLTDNKDLKSNIWNIIYLKEFDNNTFSGFQKTYMAKYSIFKYISSDSKYVIEINGAILIKKSLNKIINYYNDNNYDLGIAIHPDRNDLLLEYDAWERIRHTDQKYKKKFIEYINKHPHPDLELKNCGLLEWAIKIYKNTPVIRQFVNDVYDALCEHSNFEDNNDQCIAMWVLYNYINKINPKFFRCNLYMDGLYMERYSHNSLTHILQHHKKNYKSIEEFENAELYHKPIKLKSFNDNLY